jgi:hypothetical protein
VSDPTHGGFAMPTNPGQCDFCGRDDPSDLSFGMGHVDGGLVQIIQVCSHCRADELVHQRCTPPTRQERRQITRALRRKVRDERRKGTSA